MYTRDEPPDRPPAQLDQALDDIIHADVAAASAVAAANRPKSRAGRSIAVSLLAALGLYGMILPPAWLLPAEVVIPVRRATVRNVATELVEQADGVVSVFRIQGRLPVTAPIGNAGQVADRYQVLGAASFALGATVEDTLIDLQVTIPATGDPTYRVTTVPTGAP